MSMLHGNGHAILQDGVAAEKMTVRTERRERVDVESRKLIYNEYTEFSLSLYHVLLHFYYLYISN